MIYISESEMSERLTDGLRKSQSKALEMIKSQVKDQPEVLVEFINGVKVAAGSAHQLAHAQENPRWLSVRDILERIIGIAQVLPTMKQADNGTWFTISKTLGDLVTRCRELATAKSMPRFEVLSRLDQRMKSSPHLENLKFDASN